MFNVCLSQVHNREEEAISCNEQQISGGGAISENRTMWNLKKLGLFLFIHLLFIYLISLFIVFVLFHVKKNLRNKN